MFYVNFVALIFMGRFSGRVAPLAACPQNFSECNNAFSNNFQEKSRKDRGGYRSMDPTKSKNFQSIPSTKKKSKKRGGGLEA